MSEPSGTESAPNYGVLFEDSPDLMTLVDSNGCVVSVNDSFRDKLGYGKETLIGEPFWNYDKLMDGDQGKELLADMERGESRKFEGKLQSADGSSLATEVNISKTTIDGNDRFLAISRDISERKRLEQEQEKVIDRVTDAIVEVDSEWRFTLVNENAETLYQMSEEELLGRNFWEVFSAAQGTRFESKYRAVMENREPASLVEYFSQLEGWFDVEAYPKDDGGLAFYFVEVTEQKERERKLESANEFLSTLFETLPVGVTVLDTDGTITRANQRAEEEFGLERSEITERTYDDPGWEIFDEKGAAIDEGELPFSQVMRCGEPVNDYEHGIRIGDGEKRWFTINAAPLEGGDGEIEKVIAVISDITELRNYRRKIEEKNDRLEEFTSIVSHDLRNPLTVAEGQLELAQEKFESEHLDGVENALERMDELISTLLTLARQGESLTDLQEVALGDVVESCSRNVDIHRSNLNIETQATIRADEVRLTQLIENLLRNSVEHAGETATVRVGDLQDGFFFADDGPGIANDETESLFEAGFSTKADGTGFGLNIVKEVVEGHGWDIAVSESAEGGARFEITGTERMQE